MKHRSKKPLIIVLSCLAALLIAAACLWFFWLKDLWAAAGASPVYVQSVAEIAGLNLGSLPRYSGVVEPQATYSIQKDATKTVAEIYVTEGDQVNPGDALFRYDTEELQLQLDQAELDLEGIENQMCIRDRHRGISLRRGKSAHSHRAGHPARRRPSDDLRGGHPLFGGLSQRGCVLPHRLPGAQPGAGPKPVQAGGGDGAEAPRHGRPHPKIPVKEGAPLGAFFFCGFVKNRLLFAPTGAMV